MLFTTRAVAGDFDNMLTTGRWPIARADLATTVILEGAGHTTPRRPGSARIVSYRNTVVEVEATSPDGGWLVLNDVWHPWWAASVDGKTVPLLRANVLFRAVALPPGRHRVVFRLEPLRGVAEDLGRRLGLP